MSSVVVNARNTKGDVTGVQRYTMELLRRFSGSVDAVFPSTWCGGIKGHVWEQACLPLMLRNRVLFSPSNTGPLLTRKQVVTIHDVAALDHPERLDPKFAAFYRLLTPRLVARARRVITISEYSKQRILAHVPIDEEKVVVIPNGVDSRFSEKRPQEIELATRALSLPSRNYILCVGTLEPRKNIPRLLQAWSLIVDKLPDDIWLVLTGKHGQAGLFAKLSGLDVLPPRVHLTGHVDDAHLPALYAGAMVFAFPSLYEGFGLPPLEAMASGVPVLTGNLTSLPEVVDDAGIMVNPRSVDDIAEGLLHLIEDGALRESLILKGLSRAAQFSWDVTARKTWKILEEASLS